MLFGWWKTSLDMALLGLEAQGVIAQRMAMFALGGPAAQVEAQLMVTEKIMAASEAALMVASGASNGKVIRSYGGRSRPMRGGSARGEGERAHLPRSGGGACHGRIRISERPGGRPVTALQIRRPETSLSRWPSGTCRRPWSGRSCSRR